MGAGDIYGPSTVKINKQTNSISVYFKMHLECCEIKLLMMKVKYGFYRFYYLFNLINIFIMSKVKC